MSLEKANNVYSDVIRRMNALQKFEGTHPKVMLQRIEQMNWSFSFDPTIRKWSLKDRISNTIEKWTGWRIGEYKNYKLLK